METQPETRETKVEEDTGDSASPRVTAHQRWLLGFGEGLYFSFSFFIDAETLGNWQRGFGKWD